MLQQQQSTKSCASWYAVCQTTFVLVGCRSLCWLCLYLFVCCSHLWRRWWHTRPIYATSPCVPTDSPTWLRSACLGVFQWPFYWIIVCWHIVFADIVCWHSMRSRVCVIIVCLSVCLSVRLSVPSVDCCSCTVGRRYRSTWADSRYSAAMAPLQHGAQQQMQAVSHLQLP